tara:strand:+ start:84 stop:431 length:348 start_codon:yes stop_codon:yes gene_type:complete
MAIPSGSGTEVLKRVTLHANNNTRTEILSGTAGHIYTILCITFCDQSNAIGTVSIRVNDGANEIYICDLGGGTHPAYGSFIWNDKFVMYEDDDLDVSNSSTNGDWYVSYIDQDWT